MRYKAKTLLHPLLKAVSGQAIVHPYFAYLHIVERNVVNLIQS